MKRTDSKSFLEFMDSDHKSDEDLNDEIGVDDHTPAKSITKLVNMVTGSGQQFVD